MVERCSSGFVASLSLLAGLLLLGAASTARAGCTTSGDASAVAKAIDSAMQCNERRLRSGPRATCKRSPAPACAGSLVEDAVQLAYGANDVPALAVDRRRARKQLACQQKLGKAVAGYVGRKLRDRVGGRTESEAEQRARRGLDAVVDACRVEVVQDAAGSVLPSVGAQCAAAVPAPTGAVAARALRDCLNSLLGTWVARAGPDPQPLRPNIVLILTDDQRWDATDATHSPTGSLVMPRTRAELAARGVEFTQAFVTTPLCCPSRSSTLTGQYAHRTGVYKNTGNHGGADDFEDAQSIAVWLSAAGYRTSLVGKYLNGYAQLWGGNEPPYVPPGWTDWFGMRHAGYFDYTLIEPNGTGGYREVQYGNDPTDYSTDVLREKAKGFISEAVADGQPFFLYLAFNAPHLPQTPAPRHEGMFQQLPPWRQASYDEPDVSDKPAWLRDTPRLSAPASADVDQTRIDQLESLQAVDEAIGGSAAHGIVGVLDHLRNLGVENDTLVVFSSDNGLHWGEHRTGGKLLPYEESIRAPMLVRYPKLIPLPRIDQHIALNIDLAPTLAELAGAVVPIPQDGASLVRVLDGTAASWRTDFLTEHWGLNHVWASVRDARWKYVELPVTRGAPDTAFELELYDLASDPFELESVHADPEHAARRAAMAARLRQIRPSWPIDSDPDGSDPSGDDD